MSDLWDDVGKALEAAESSPDAELEELVDWLREAWQRAKSRGDQPEAIALVSEGSQLDVDYFTTTISPSRAHFIASLFVRDLTTGGFKSEDEDD